MNTREKNFEFIKKNKRVSPKMISDNFDLGKPMIHCHLKKLLDGEK